MAVSAQADPPEIRTPRTADREHGATAHAQTFAIVFHGLVTHVGDDGPSGSFYKSHAAVLAAAGHEPVVEVAGEYRIPSGGDLRISLLPGDHISFDLPSGPASTTDSFRAAIPALSRLISDGSLREQVKDALPDPSVVAYVTYPVGELATAYPSRYPLEFRFADGSFAAKHCSADAVVYQTKTNRAVMLKIERATGERVFHRLTSGAVVHVANQPDVIGHHFHMYQSMTTAREIALPTEDLTGRCSGAESVAAAMVPTRVRPGRISTLDMVPGCGNSSWP